MSTHSPMPRPADLAPPGRFLTIAEVQRETSFSRTTIWRRIREGEFPKAVNLGGNRRGWSERAIEEWKARRLAASQ